MTVVSADDQFNARALPEVRRIPRMRRLGYLQALLQAIGQDGCTKAETREAIIQAVRELDAGKAAALGRKPPKVPKGDSLTEQCIQMATRLGLVERRRDQLTKTSEGAALSGTNLHQTRSTLFALLWSVFPHFRSIVTAVCARTEGFNLPVNRYGGLFATAVEQQGLIIDQMSFEIVRDLATELLILNWCPVFGEHGVQEQVYPIGTATTVSLTDGTSGPHQPIILPPTSDPAVYAESYAVPISARDSWIFIGNTIDTGQFESALWKNYLQLTDRVPRFPVLYPVLRDAVCKDLRIADPYFDEIVRQLLSSPRRLEIYPAEGVLGYSATTSITYKQVPPRTVAGQFMTFLKIDRMEVRDVN